MIAGLPYYISIVFALTVLLTLFFIYRASEGSNLFLMIASVWIIGQSFVSFDLFYANTSDLPPRFLLLVIPPLITILWFLLSKRGRTILDNLNPAFLTSIHLVRIPVEIVLYWLFIGGAVPQLMTFAGRNFDILAGITAPLIIYYGYAKHKIGRTGLISWNIVGIGLLLFIVVNAVFSAPFPFQQFGFEQPNIGVFHFPFALLPGFVVPVVLFAHVVCLRALITSKQQKRP